MTSPVDLCNIAGGQVGAQTKIQGINPPMPPNSVLAQTASDIYDLQVENVFRAAHWNCARFQKALTLLRSAAGMPGNPTGALPIPPIPWLFMYEYPSDCLKMRFVIPLPQIPGTQTPIMSNVGINYFPNAITSIPFVPAVYINDQGNEARCLLTNAPVAQGVYTARIPNPDLWDPSLRNAVVGTLAAWFVNPINMQKELLKERVAMAVGLVQSARISDGNEGITSMDVIPDWIQVRACGGAYLGANGVFAFPGPQGGYIAGWDALGMPDGVSY